MKTETSFHLKEMKLEVTHNCLLSCVHCSSMSKVESGLSMDWPTSERILDEAYEMGANEVAFSGGEPLLWEYIENGISKSVENGFHTILYTTGNAPDTEKILENLQTIGLNRVVFSVFGANQEDHEMVTKQHGSFERTINMARHCSDIGLKTEFHFVALSWNFMMLPHIVELALASGAEKTSILRLVPQGRGSKICNGQLSNTQNLELRRTIKHLRDKGHNLRLGSPYNFLMLKKNPQCRSGVDRMTIGPDYRIFPCDAFKHISPEDIGASNDFSNVGETSLKECWENSDFFRVIREYLMGDIDYECGSCSMLNRCNSGCVAQKIYAYGGLIKGPDPMCLNASIQNRDFLFS